MKEIVIIPAYQPDESLLALVLQLRLCGLSLIIIDDGSGDQYAQIFRACSAHATVLTHPENRGKGAALKTGLGYLQEHAAPPYAVVTADADGQHAPNDILRVLEAACDAPDTLILGSRALKGQVPLRSRLGNAITRAVFHLSTGARVYDTQTGLRAFTDQSIDRMLQIPGERYEYEMNVLLQWAKERRPIRELPIETIYLNGNRSSHFHAVRDSYRIYKEIILFSGASFISFLVDYGLFCLLRLLGGALAFSNITARFVSAILNYQLNRKAVFRSQASPAQSALRYTALAALILTANTLILKALTAIGLPAMAAKLLTEALLFTLSWLVQRKWVFRSDAVEEGENPMADRKEAAA